MRPASIPLSLPQIIDDSRGVLAQLDTAKLSAMFDELRVGLASNGVPSDRIFGGAE
jgi:hypothetical protein